GRKLALVAIADDLMGLCGRSDGGARCSKLPIEGLATGCRIGHLVQRVRKCRVVGRDRRVVFSPRTAQLALKALCIEDWQRHRGACTADVRARLGEVIDSE